MISAEGEATVLGDGDQRVAISPTNTGGAPATVALEPAGASGADPVLTRGRVTFSVGQPRDIGIEFSLTPLGVRR